MTQSNEKQLAPTTGFGLNLLKSEVKANPGDNVLVSPASVSIALAMTMNGAAGQTKKDIGTTLVLPNADDTDGTNRSYANLLAELRDNKALGVELAVANAIWANQDFTFNPAFLDANRDNFGAQVTNADFGAEQTLTDINQWASDNTKTRIPKILDEITPEKIMFLLNAVYFKGEWNAKFDKSNTSDQDFQTPAGAKKHPLMVRAGNIVHVEREKYTAVKLPFGESKRVNLYVYLPNEGTSVDGLVESLSESDLTDLAQIDHATQGTLHLPRFQVEFDVTLNDTLKALGMADAFSGATADFSAMAPGRIFISEVKHKTFAKFDEEGGEAAAVTSVGVGIECVFSPWEMRVDRPFVAALYDEGTGSLLFIGVVNDPK